MPPVWHIQLHRSGDRNSFSLLHSPTSGIFGMAPPPRQQPQRTQTAEALAVTQLAEEWDIARPMARMVISPPQGIPQQPDHPNWSWHEYGMRVGVWRLMKVFKHLGVTPCVTMNAKICETYPQVVEACMKNGWELNAHSYDQQPMHKLENQKEVVDKACDIIQKFSGKRPVGWFGPGLTQTFDTLDYLSQSGI